MKIVFRGSIFSGFNGRGRGVAAAVTVNYCFKTKFKDLILVLDLLSQLFSIIAPLDNLLNMPFLFNSKYSWVKTIHFKSSQKLPSDNSQCLITWNLLFSSTERRSLNTKVGLHTTSTTNHHKLLEHFSRRDLERTLEEWRWEEMF